MARILLIILIFSAACSRSDQVTIPLPKGSYQVVGPLCASSGERPHYPSLEYALALLDFNNLETRLLERGGTTDEFFVIETFASSDCKLQSFKPYNVGFDGLFGSAVPRKFVFDPPNCQLELTALEETAMIGTSDSPIFHPGTKAEADLYFEVEKDGDTYTLLTLNAEPYLSSWHSFGCQDQDRLQYNLTRLR